MFDGHVYQPLRYSLLASSSFLHALTWFLESKWFKTGGGFDSLRLVYPPTVSSYFDYLETLE